MTTGGRVRICVFAKPPLPGRVKTRLARTVGSGPAADLALAFLRDTWSAIRALDWADTVIATTDVRAMAATAPAGAEIWPQGSGDLGARMTRVLRRALRTHEAAMVIGTDVPDLPANRLTAARRSLRAHDAVLGPAEDGGFYLLGLTRCPPDLLAGLAWSQPRTGHDTLARMRSLGLDVATVASWHDVDDEAGLRRLRQRPVTLARRAPATAAAIAQLNVTSRRTGDTA